MDVARNPWTGYDPTTGAGSVAVELVTPAISSPPFFASAELRAARGACSVRSPGISSSSRASTTATSLLDVTRDRMQAEWYHVDTVAQRSDQREQGGQLRLRARLVAARACVAQVVVSGFSRTRVRRPRLDEQSYNL